MSTFWEWCIMALWTIFLYEFLSTHIYVWTYIFNSLGYIPRNGITRSYGNSMFNISRKCQTIFQKSHHFTFSPSMYEDSNISTSSSILVIFFIVALVGVKWYLTVISIHSFYFIIGQLYETELKNILDMFKFSIF